MKTTRQWLIVVAVIGLLAGGRLSYDSWCAVAADSGAPRSNASTNNLASQLIGTWRLEVAPNPGTPSGIGTRLKYYTGTHWSVVQPDPETGVIVFQHGGRYVLEGNELRETVLFAGPNTRTLIGTTGVLKIQIDGDTYKQVDSTGRFNETWKRVK